MSEAQPKPVKENIEYFQKQLDIYGPNRNALMLEFDPKRKNGKFQLVYISPAAIEKLKDTHEYRHSYEDVPRFDRVYKKKGK